MLTKHSVTDYHIKMKQVLAFTLCVLLCGAARNLGAQESLPNNEGALERTGSEETADAAEEKPGLIKRTLNYISSLPFGYDFGCEPTLNGSLTYLNIKYKWSEETNTFSKFLFNYGSTLAVDPKEIESKFTYSIKKYQVEDKAFDFRLIPWGKQFDSKKKEGRYFTVEPGLNFRMEPSSSELTYSGLEEKVFFILDMSQQSKLFFLRPYYSTSLSTPIGKHFNITLDCLYAPVYFYFGNNSVSYYLQTYDGVRPIACPLPTISMNHNGIVENYVDVNLIFGVFNLFAISGRLIYERQHITDYSLNQDFSTSGRENKYENLHLKIGASLINIGKASLRIKTGVFYQWDWRYNHNADQWASSGKWIFGVGMKNLY